MANEMRREGSGEVVVITGAGEAGSRYARAFAKQGKRVIVATKNLKQAARLKQALKEGGCEITAYKLDVADKSQVEAFAEWMEKEYGQVDILIHTAANYIPEEPLTCSEEGLWESLEVNLLGMIFLNQMTGKLMEKAGRGRIIHYGCGGWEAADDPEEMAWGISRAGAAQAVRYFARRLSGTGVTVNGIVPVQMDSAASIRKHAEGTAVQRPEGLPEDCIELGLYLAGEEASRITGQILRARMPWSQGSRKIWRCGFCAQSWETRSM